MKMPASYPAEYPSFIAGYSGDIPRRSVLGMLLGSPWNYFSN